jgi:hypothetical protein
MAIEVREPETDGTTESVPERRSDVFERAIGAIVLVAGLAGAIWAIPSTVRHPMALAVTVSVTAIGAGVVWRKPWAFSGLLCLGVLLCSASVGYLLVNGLTLFTFSWFFVPGLYFSWVGLQGIRQGRRTRAQPA